ncbi:MAG: hypothetical protein E6H07_15435 [Bacteroidetes bacterium]|nr:MAG: hypothetical protein E6H07_15435 [Bacteroidota bacterium]
MDSKKHFFNASDADYINIRFACPYCQAEVFSGYLPVHDSNLFAKNSKDSYVHEDHEAICDDCNESYWLTMYVGNDDAYIKMESSDEIPSIKIDEISKEEIEYEINQYEAISANVDLLETFKSGINKLKKLNAVDLKDKELNTILKMQIYTGLIATMETFLSDAFINRCMTDKILFKKFVQTYPEFRQRKLELRDIFEQYDNLNETVKSILLKIIYHDLSRVKEMYQNTFEIDFPDLEKPIRCVLVRHDIVHRNGKTIDGNVLKISSVDVTKAINVIAKFIMDIANKLNLRR